MKRRYLEGRVAIVCFWLVGSVLHAQATEPALFQALNLIRFSKPVELPEVRLAALEGKEMRLRAFRGKIVLLNFWTTW